MATSRNQEQSRKAAILLNIWLKICIGGLLLSCTPFASAIRNTGGLSLNIPEEEFRGKFPRHDSNLAFSTSSTTMCNYHQDLSYTQDTSTYLNGMPVFHVAFYNTCVDCPFGEIHIHCGDFASAFFVDPRIFRKIGVNDCLLNNGAPLAPQDSIAFEYSSTFSFPMDVATAPPLC